MLQPERLAPARHWLRALIVAVAGLVGCHQPVKPAEETVPPAPVKWEGIRHVVLEEWTELVGTTQALPDHAARVTAPVEGSGSWPA